MTTLGKRVKEQRENKGWSQEQLAEKVSRRGYKIGQSAIGNIEAERVKNPKCIVQLAAALEVSPMWLQTGLGKPEAPPASNQPKPPPDVFVNYSSDPTQEMINLLMNELYDPASMPRDSAKEKAVFTLLRYLKQKR